MLLLFITKSKKEKSILFFFRFRPHGPRGKMYLANKKNDLAFICCGFKDMDV
jgi:hypothetical protein